MLVLVDGLAHLLEGFGVGGLEVGRCGCVDGEGAEGGGVVGRLGQGCGGEVVVVGRAEEEDAFAVEWLSISCCPGMVRDEKKMWQKKEPQSIQSRARTLGLGD